MDLQLERAVERVTERVMGGDAHSVQGVGGLETEEERAALEMPRKMPLGGEWTRGPAGSPGAQGWPGQWEHRRLAGRMKRENDFEVYRKDTEGQ